MIDPKTKTEEVLVALKEIEGLTVYFQKPQNLKMTYPCAVLDMEGIDNVSADNDWFKPTYNFKLTVIEKTKHSKFIPLVIEKFKPYVRYDGNSEYSGLFNNYFTINI